MILTLLEPDLGLLTLQALTWARALADQLQVPLHAVLIGGEAAAASEKAQAYGVTTLHHAQHAELQAYAPGAWAQCVAELIKTQAPQVVVAPSTEHGLEVMAHVAARLQLPLAANCLAVHPGETYTLTRQRWGGSLLEEARLTGAVKLLTIAPHAIEPTPAPAAALEVKAFTPTLSAKDLRVRVTTQRSAKGDKLSLAEARLVVGGGRGVGSAENFKALEELAELLNGVVGCSRAVTSLGWRPHTDQIGQTGARIAAELYIACGISGAIQHIVGCRGAKRILAINTDPEASIMTHADYAVIGDLNEVVPALVAELRKRRGG